MRTVEMRSEDVLAAAGEIPEDVPVFMLNLLRYREWADYDDRTDVAPCSGREAYFERYVPAFNEIASEGGGAELVWAGTVLSRVIGPTDERWDDIAIVQYPGFAAFRSILENPRYLKEAEPHRTAALEDSRLIATTRMS